MTPQELLNSGSLELYALGMLPDAERAEVDNMLAQSAELRGELAAINTSIERFAERNRVNPPPRLKEQIASKLGLTPSAAAVAPAAKGLPWGWIVAGLLAVVGTSAGTYFFSRSQEAEAQIPQLNSRIDSLLNQVKACNDNLLRSNTSFAVVTDKRYQQVPIKATAEGQTYEAVVFWNKETKEIYLSGKDLPALPDTNDFQLWALVDGKPVDLGTFNEEADSTSLKNMKGLEFDNPAAFAVTIEPKGGRPTPTLEKLIMLGNI